MKVQGIRKIGRPKRRWLDRLSDDIKGKGLSGNEMCYRATCISSNIYTTT